ncbi:MAG: PHB depolymerase family esterase [Kutzneria sp.]|nr:PHB depolymerase family esterase [Kutzneria sp.]MBV9844798.1 PHB depolymerase family esterase [Kutzneria sp.]
MAPNSLVTRPWRLFATVLTAVLACALSTAAAIPAAATEPVVTAGLGQVADFGPNPGNLGMFDYVPPGLPSGAPLVVALHGCSQSAQDYFAHSGWTKYADQWHFAVVFPQQSSANNILSCFNWFLPAEDGRGQGEAASIRQMVTYAASTFHIDPRRVYLTGLSAGGGMVADLLADYPDVFAAGSIDSGLPAQCATTSVEASGCQSGGQNRTPAQWGDLVRNSDRGYTGPWPRVAIWQGTADFTVNAANATELTEQWTNVWGIGQRPSSTKTLPGGTTENIYNDGTGAPAVQTYTVAGMGHGLAVHPGAGADQCGTVGAFFLDAICSTYYTALFWGLTSE